MSPADWVWMAALCMTGALGHWLLIRCYEVAEASAVQPFRVFTAGFCINCRDCGVFRNVAQQCCGWGLDDYGGRCFCTIERAAEGHRQLVLC